jgi:hypothetical protein
VKNKFLFLFVFIVLSFIVVQLVSAQGSVTIPNPISAGNFQELLLKIAGGVGMFIGVLGTIMVLVSAILFVTSAGSPERMGTAKKALLYAIIGIIIGGSATVIVEIIKETLN